VTTAFVVNSGSSSIKWQWVDVATGEALQSGQVTRIGEPGSGAADHESGMRGILEQLDGSLPTVIGHRVVHGGSEFSEATLVTSVVEARIEALSSLAPLHNPANLAGIRAARAAFPGVPNVAVFDTAFHHTLSPAAYTYAIDPRIAARHGVRRYGFHGTSYQYVAGRAALVLGRPLETLKLIAFHLGNGASVCAIDGGRSVDTSMGMTPLAGLVMGTRSGDIDPGALLHLGRGGLGFAEIDALLNRGSGMLGLTGTGDLRDVQNAADNGDDSARLALDVYVARLRHYLGAYLVLLGGGGGGGGGGVDAIVFTAGVGENSREVRAAALAGLGGFGIQLDSARNDAPSRGERRISADSSRVQVLVIPTNEEFEIARQSLAAVG